MPCSVFSFLPKANGTTLVTSLVLLHTSAPLPPTAVAPTGAIPGDILLALSALTQVLFPYPRFALMNLTDILSHKVLPAKSTLVQTVVVPPPLLLDTPGMEISDSGTTTWDLSAAGGNGRTQFLVTG